MYALLFCKTHWSPSPILFTRFDWKGCKFMHSLKECKAFNFNPNLTSSCFLSEFPYKVFIFTFLSLHVLQKFCLQFVFYPHFFISLISFLCFLSSRRGPKKKKKLLPSHTKCLMTQNVLRLLFFAYVLSFYEEWEACCLFWHKREYNFLLAESALGFFL